jgi:hypothetical protein
VPNALRFNWGSIAIASMSVWLLSFVAVAGAIFIYAFSLGWAARGAPDSAAIQQFADTVGPVWSFRLVLILTGVAAIWIGRRVTTQPILHGPIVGWVVAALPVILSGRFERASIGLVGVALAAGALGAWVGSQTRPRRT